MPGNHLRHFKVKARGTVNSPGLKRNQFKGVRVMSHQLPQKIRKGSASVQERLIGLNHTEPFAVLATQGADIPYTSLVAYALTPDLKGLIFCTPKETRKYKNIVGSGHVSLLIDSRSVGKSLMETEAITVLGLARPMRKSFHRDETARVFLRKHPDFEQFIKAPTTALILVKIARCIHVDKFQAISVWEPAKEEA